MYSIGTYEVPLIAQSNIYLQASLKPAVQEDMNLSSNWYFNWKGIWENTDFDYQNIIKLDYKNNILGLIRYDFYMSDENIPYAIEVLQLESMPKNTRIGAPIGQWLLWYVSELALNICSFDEDNKALILLDSLEEAIPYYSDTIKMQPKGWVTIAAGEDGYAFEFTVAGARNFCERQRNTHGFPKRIYP